MFRVVKCRLDSGLVSLDLQPDRWTEVRPRNTFRLNCRTLPPEREYSATAASRSAAVRRLAQLLRKLA